MYIFNCRFYITIYQQIHILISILLYRSMKLVFYTYIGRFHRQISIIKLYRTIWSVQCTSYKLLFTASLLAKTIHITIWTLWRLYYNHRTFLVFHRHYNYDTRVIFYRRILRVLYLYSPVLCSSVYSVIVLIVPNTVQLCSTKFELKVSSDFNFLQLLVTLNECLSYSIFRTFSRSRSKQVHI